ncbi:MAG: YggS family pyridoxal phosphate-dependent enzyme [Desulfobulbus sp.]|nr:YggS family pyridoxal phosphate-dependent enzyme [Desulfobulbus sp.]
MICDNLAHIQKTIARSAHKAGRGPGTVKLVAASKTVQPDAMLTAVRCGQMVFGENYIQEAADKMVRLPVAIHWHFIGHLQSNKTRQAVELFDVIETVDRWKVAAALDSHARSFHKNLSILLQVNIGREPQKSGVLPEAAETLLRKIAGETSLRVLGLMTMPPYSPEPERSRPYFRALSQLAQRLAALGLFADNDRVDLSMGMSNDYQIAIEEGATLVRVGTALFGTRQP